MTDTTLNVETVPIDRLFCNPANPRINDPAVFNGSCGAESGWVPVSAVSPSILVSTIEIEKRTRSQSRPPILDPPPMSAGAP